MMNFIPQPPPLCDEMDSHSTPTSEASTPIIAVDMDTDTTITHTPATISNAMPLDKSPTARAIINPLAMNSTSQPPVSSLEKAKRKRKVDDVEESDVNMADFSSSPFLNISNTNTPEKRAGSWNEIPKPEGNTAAERAANYEAALRANGGIDAEKAGMIRDEGTRMIRRPRGRLSGLGMTSRPPGGPTMLDIPTTPLPPSTHGRPPFAFSKLKEVAMADADGLRKAKRRAILEANFFLAKQAQADGGLILNDIPASTSTSTSSSSTSWRYPLSELQPNFEQLGLSQPVIEYRRISSKEKAKKKTKKRASDHMYAARCKILHQGTLVLFRTHASGSYRVSKALLVSKMRKWSEVVIAHGGTGDSMSGDIPRDKPTNISLMNQKLSSLGLPHAQIQYTFEVGATECDNIRGLWGAECGIEGALDGKKVVVEWKRCCSKMEAGEEMAKVVLGWLDGVIAFRSEMDALVGGFEGVRLGAGVGGGDMVDAGAEKAKQAAIREERQRRMEDLIGAFEGVRLEGLEEGVSGHALG